MKFAILLLTILSFSAVASEREPTLQGTACSRAMGSYADQLDENVAIARELIEVKRELGMGHEESDAMVHEYDGAIYFLQQRLEQSNVKTEKLRREARDICDQEEQPHI